MRGAERTDRKARKSPKEAVSSGVRRSGGATRKARANNTVSGSKKVPSFTWLNYFLKLGVVAVAAGVITGGLVWFNPKEKIAKLSTHPINEVELQGNFSLLQRDEATKLVSDLISGTFIDLDISNLRDQLAENPWVDTVSVSREWPDKLVVRVVEQQPIAQWGKKGFLNMRGDIIEVEKTTKIQSLPMLNGDDRYAKEIMQQYLVMNKLLQPFELSLSAVSLDDTLAWQITLGPQVTVKLGRDRILQKLQSLTTAKTEVLLEDFNKIQSIDMRYSNGFAVSWKNEEAKVATGG